MLKRVLGETGESGEVREEDKQSHHSDSIMECGGTPRQHTGNIVITSLRAAVTKKYKFRIVACIIHRNC